MEAVQLEPPLTLTAAYDTMFASAMLILSISLSLGPSQSWPDTSLSGRMAEWIHLQVVPGEAECIYCHCTRVWFPAHTFLYVCKECHADQYRVDGACFLVRVIDAIKLVEYVMARSCLQHDIYSENELRYSV